MKKTSLSISTLPQCHIIDPNGHPNRSLMPGSRSSSRLSESLPVSVTITHSPHKPLNNPCCGLLKAHRPAPRGLLSLTALIASTLALSTLLTPMAYAALSATTANTIEGTPPYLTFDGGVTKATNTDELLMIKLSDGRVYKASDALASATTPIVLPAGDVLFTNIQSMLPLAVNTMPLATLVNAPYNYAMDDDGDGNFNATGTLGINITDVNGVVVSRAATMDPCKSPYKFTLTTTAGTLTTQFGAPNSSTFNGASATYYITSGTPIACFAKPNLSNNYAGYIPTQWDPAKGFIPQNINIPSSNFPATGFNGAYFDITLGNTTAAQVIASSGNGGGLVFDTNGASNVISVISVVSPNVLRVMLHGPSSGQTTTFGLGPVAVAGLPATFELKSGTTKVYTFTLSKWFIPKSGGHRYDGVGYPGGQTVPQYCASIPGFRVPSVLDYTNAIPAAQIGLGGSVGGHYIRRIYWGGVFGEWGNVSTYYPLSDWETSSDWASEPWSATYQYIVGSGIGDVYYYHAFPHLVRAACVSP